MSDGVDKTDLASSRRAVLRLGAATVPAALTLRASPAAAASILACRIPFEQTPWFRVSGQDKWIDSSGNLVAKPANFNETAGPFPPLAAGGYYTGEQVKIAFQGGAMPTGKPLNYSGKVTNSYSAQAHYKYLYNNVMNSSAPGYTCMTSVRTASGY